MNYKCEDCNGGRNCDCPPMIAPKTALDFDPYRPGTIITITGTTGKPFDAVVAPPPPTIWQHLWKYAVGFLAALGAMALAACIGLYLGGYFEFLIKELNK